MRNLMENPLKTPKRLKIALFLLLTAFCLLCIYFAAHHVKTPSETTTQIPFSQTTDKNVVKSKLHVDDTSAGQIVTQIERIHDGKVEPNVTYYVQAPNLQKAADLTTTQIKNQDPSLPKEAIAKSDRTIVTANDEKQKVEVYKINLRNNHKIKSGVTYIDGKAYASVGYQAGRIEAIAHAEQTGLKGGTVMYTIKEW